MSNSFYSRRSQPREFPHGEFQGFRRTWDHQIGRFELMYQIFYPIITLRVSRIDKAKYIVVTAVCVLSVCLSLAACPHYYLDVTSENGRGCLLVVHYWADLQSVQRFHCYDSIHVCKLIDLHTANAYSGERETSASACTRCMPGCL